MFWIFPLILVILSATVVVIILAKKIPNLRVIDVDSIPKEKTKKTKEAIIMKKFERFTGEKVKVVNQKAGVVIGGVSKVGRRMVQKLYALEQYYKNLQKGMVGADVATDPNAMKRLFQEAADFIKEGEYFQAEKRYIEIISHNPKASKAYEELGNLYLLDRKPDQARETLAFAIKLKPDDASVSVSLGEVEMSISNHESAFGHFKNAVEVRPHNPRYIDYFIESAILSGHLAEAKRGIDMLSSVNPENKKLKEFERRVTEAAKI